MTYLNRTPFLIKKKLRESINNLYSDYKFVYSPYISTKFNQVFSDYVIRLTQTALLQYIGELLCYCYSYDYHYYYSLSLVIVFTSSHPCLMLLVFSFEQYVCASLKIQFFIRNTLCKIHRMTFFLIVVLNSWASEVSHSSSAVLCVHGFMLLPSHYLMLSEILFRPLDWFLSCLPSHQKINSRLLTDLFIYDLYITKWICV